MVTSAIWKEPRAGRVALHKLTLDGDGHADLSAHGGENKAVYCYPLQHYEYWRTQLPDRELTMGNFGENFDVEGFAEDSVFVGDRFVVGSAEVVVTQPRLPCYKLGVRFDLADMVKRFLASGRTGFYLAVSREGEVGAGDEIRQVSRDSRGVSVADITRLYIEKRFSTADIELLQRALAVEVLPHSWKDYFRERMQSARA